MLLLKGQGDKDRYVFGTAPVKWGLPSILAQQVPYTLIDDKGIFCFCYFITIVFVSLFIFDHFLSLIQETMLFIIKASNSGTREEYNEKIIVSRMSSKEDFGSINKISVEHAVFIIWIQICWGNWYWYFSNETCIEVVRFNFSYIKNCSHMTLFSIISRLLLLTPAEKIDFLSDSHFRAITHMVCLLLSVSSRSIPSFFKTWPFLSYAGSYL